MKDSFSASTRRAQGLESCWRCKILDERCDGRRPCGKCARSGRTSLRVGCQRGELCDRFKDKLPCIPGYGSPEWFVSTTDGTGSVLRFRMTLDDPSLEIRDVDLSMRETTDPVHFTASVEDFLMQFCDMDVRWKSYYDSGTNGLILICVRIQQDLLARVSPNTLPTEDTLVIAWALRALAFLYNFSNGKFFLPFMNDTEMPSHIFTEPKTSRGENYTIEICRCNREIPERLRHATDGWQFSSMLQHVVRITQKILFRRQPTDWPRVFCVLLLFELIIVGVSYDIPWIDPFKRAEDDLKNVHYTLIQLYEAATRGCCHPLTSNWNCEAYTTLVGGGDVAIAHFHLLHQKWVKEGLSGYDGDSLASNIEVLTSGWERNC